MSAPTVAATSLEGESSLGGKPAVREGESKEEAAVRIVGDKIRNTNYQ
jgi:hypothetical protein